MALLFLLAVSFTSKAIARIDYISCTPCSDKRMSKVAMLSGKNGVVNIIDFNSFRAKSFYVSSEPGGEHIISLQVPAQVESGLEQLKAVKESFKKEFNGNITIQSLNPYLYNKNDFSIIKIARFSSRQADVSQALTKYIHDRIGHKSLVNLAGIFGAAALDSTLSTSYSVKITFDSAGTDYFEFKFSEVSINSDGQISVLFSPVPNSGRMGNILLTSDGRGGFELSGNVTDIEGALSGMGYNINYGSGTRIPPTGTVTIACTGSKSKPCTVPE